jgi:hypothetical protein
MGNPSANQNLRRSKLIKTLDWINKEESLCPGFRRFSRPQRPAGEDAGHPLTAGIGPQKVRFRRTVDGRMEGIDEMWMGWCAS